MSLRFDFILFFISACHLREIQQLLELIYLAELMDIGLQHRKILGFQQVRFSSLLLRVKMMWNFEFCCYSYLVLVELF